MPRLALRSVTVLALLLLVGLVALAGAPAGRAPKNKVV